VKVETRELPLQTREAPLRSFDEKARTVDVVWTTGAKVRRYDWHRERYYDEELSLAPSHVRMGRLASGRAPLLDSHSSWGVRSTLGVVASASLNGTEGVGTVKFSRRATDVMEDVRDGVTPNVSVGYRVHRYEMVPPSSSDGVWTYRAVDWEPYELSFVSIPADAGAHARGEFDPFDGKRSAVCQFINPAEIPANPKEHPMIRSFASTLGVTVEKDADDAAVRSAVVAYLGLKAESTDDEIVAAAVKRAAPAASPAQEAPADAVATARAEAVTAERKRNAEIITLCAKHGADAAFQARAIEQGWTAERAGLEILNERAAKGANVGPANTAPSSEPTGRSGGAWDHTVRKFGGTP
jgi:hypothetical protein